jgi:hypothetical protein
MITATLITAIALRLATAAIMPASAASIANAPADRTAFTGRRGRVRASWRGGRAPVGPAGRPAVTLVSSA